MDAAMSIAISQTRAISDAAFLSSAAYSSSGTAADILAGTDWRAVDLTAWGIDQTLVQNGFYVSGGAIALVAHNSNGNIAVAFRGTDGGWQTLLADVDGILGTFALHYLKYNALISAILSHAGSAQILVAGHSLGGVMVETMLRQFSSDTRLLGVSFGSPGLPSGEDNPRSDTRLLNIGQIDLQGLGDPVYRGVSSSHVSGIDLHISLPNELDLPISSVALGNLGQHSMALYQANTNRISAELAKFGINLTDYTYIVGTDPFSRDLLGSGGQDVIIGDAGSDNLVGFGGNDVLDGGNGSDTLSGDGGIDLLRGGSGDDYIYGGAGSDIARFDDQLGDSLQSGQYSGFYSLHRNGGTVTVVSRGPGGEGIDTLVGVEILQFKDQAISIYSIRDESGGTTPGGTASDGGIAPVGGGSSGHEGTVVATTVAGAPITGNNSSEQLTGTDAGELISGLGGDDVLTGYGGRDTFDGGQGNDTVDYSYEPVGIDATINLATGTAIFPGYYTETLTSIENVWSGAGNDTITGTTGDNDLRGGPGNDIITAGAGNDIVYGDWKYSDQGGVDTAILSYTFGVGYTVSGTAGALRIIGADGDDRFYNVETFTFAGGVTRTAAEVLAAGVTWVPTTPITAVSLATSGGRLGTMGNGASSAIAVLSNGRYVIVWTDLSVQTDEPNIRLQIMNADGTKFGSELLVNTTTAGMQLEPAVATLGAGRFVVAWTDFSQTGLDTTGTAVRSQIYNNDGTRSGNEIVANVATAGDQVLRSAVELGDGRVLLSWSDNYGSNFWGRILSSDGSFAGGQFALAQPPQTAIVLASGNILLTWVDYNYSTNATSVHARAYDLTGTAIGADITVNQNPARFAGAAIACQLTNGSVAFLWSEAPVPGSEFAYYGRIMGADGQWVASQFTVEATRAAGYLQMQALDGGSFVAVYERGSTGGIVDVVAQVFNQVGTTLYQTIVDTAPTYGVQATLDVQSLGGDRFAVAWTDGGDILTREYGPSTANIAPVAQNDTVSTPETGAFAGQLFANNGQGADADPDGDPLAVSAVNGLAGNIGHPITLASGATVVVNPDGRFVYDPNHAFDSLKAGQTGTDSFTYTISDGFGHTSSATVTLTIDGVDQGVIISGNAANETYAGTAQSDQISGGAGDDTISGGASYDWLQGGDGNDILTGDDGNDILEGDAGADQLAGGSGIDDLAGGDGNDRFIVAAGDLVAGDVIDGGADTDALELLGGTHSLSGVTLLNIEQIKLADVAATTVTLASADQALLFSSSAGGSDTVIFDGDLTAAQLATLATAGIEHVQTTSGVLDVTRNYIGGVLQEVITEDPTNIYPFVISTDTRDASGATTSLHTVFDNGIDETIHFEGGKKTITTKLDTDDAFDWSSQEFTFAADGVKLASVLNTADNGDTTLTTFGATSNTTVFTDVSGSNSLTSRSQTTGLDGKPVAATMSYDNGRITTLDYSNGILSRYKDDDTHNVLPDYKTNVVEYNAAGVEVRQVLTLDNNNTYEIQHVGGMLTRTIYTDGSHAAAYDTYSVEFTGGAVTKTTTVYDNRLRTETTYSGGHRTSYFQSDDGNVFTYDTLAVTYKADGSVATQVTTLDNGHKDVLNNVDGGILQGGSFNDTMIGHLGMETFVFGPNGGNDFVKQFENGVDLLDLSAFGFADFAATRAHTIANGTGGIYMTFANGEHLAVNGLTLATFDASDVKLA